MRPRNVLGFVGLIICVAHSAAFQTKEPKVRVIAASHLPLSERLLPDDEVVEIEQNELLSEPTFETVDDVLVYAVSSAGLVATAELVSVQARLIEPAGRTIGRHLEFKLRERLVGRPRYQVPPGTSFLVRVDGGELSINSVLVRAKPSFDYRVGQTYLVFAGNPQGALMESLTPPLIVTRGRLVAPSDNFPLHGKSLKELIPEIRRLARVI
jgi:hypothetical protein